MSDRTIVITGATRGLGRALTDFFVRNGDRVAGCGRSEKQISQLRQHGAPHLFEVLDVTDRAAVADWARRVRESLGPPDLLINNAALINRPAPLWEVPADEFDHLIDVNVKGVVNVCRAFLPAMIDRGRGVVVNLSSGWGRSASANVGPYNASKFAIEGLTKALAQELPRGMAAIPLSPGVIDTEMLRTVMRNTSAHPNASEWAESAGPYLLSLGPEHNGQSLTVDRD